MRHKRTTNFFIYLFSYLAVLLVPLIVLVGICGRKVNQFYQKEVLNNITEDIQALSEALDSQVESMLKTTQQLRLMVDLDRLDLNNDLTGAKPIMTILSAYCSTNNFASDIILYTYNDYLISTSSTCRADFFSRGMYQYANTNPSDLKDLRSSNERLIFVPNQPVRQMDHVNNYITVIVPMYTDYETNCGTCIFLVKDDAIHRLIQHLEDKYDAAVFLTDHHGNLFYSSESPDIPSDTLKSLITESLETTSSALPEYGNFLICGRQSAGIGLGCTAFIPKLQPLTDRLNLLSNILVISTLIVLLIVSVVVYFNMRVVYTPLKRLYQKALKLHPAASQNELHIIDNTLDFLNDQNNSLTTKLESNMETSRNILLQELLMGYFPNRESFNSKCAEHDLFLPCDNFFVSCVLCHSEQNDLSLLARTMKELLCSQITSYYVFTPTPNQLYFIHSGPSISESELFEFFERTRLMAEESTRLAITIGIGGFCKGTDALPQSFLEAGSALEYRFVKGNRNTILFQEIGDTESNAVKYPRYSFEKLRNALAAHKRQDVENALTELIDHIQNNHLPLFLAKGICFEILKLFSEYSAENPTLYNSDINLFALSDADTIYEILDILSRFRDSAQVNTSVPSKVNSAQLLNDIVAYIQTNCLRCDFSIQGTAEHFALLPPNLSQFFKENTGQNILDYATDIRMEKAKKLLHETELPLKELGYQVGYYNVSSFIRRFKQTQGITPGEYRHLAE